MLHAALHLTAHARADIVAIDATAALAAPGVEAVFTAADVPGDLRVGIIYKDWPVMIPVGGTTSYAGDVLAIVVADTRAHARAASALVEVTYEVLPPNTDPVAALADAAPLSVWGTDTNVLSTSAYRRGADFDDAFAASAFTVHETFETQRIEHAFLEPESTLAVPSGSGDDRRLHVYSGGQGVWDDRNDIAAVLALGNERVTVELVSNGGAFGGKEDMSNQAQASLAAWLLDRPVKCTLSREESSADARQTASDPLRVLGGLRRRRPAQRPQGARHRRLGRLRQRGDEGARTRRRPRLRRLPVAALDIETIAVRTNNLVCGAFRGFGANQAQFALEGVLDRLAEQVGITGWEIRKRNVIRPGDEWGPGPDHGRRGRRRRGLPRSDQARVRRGDRRRQGGRPRARASRTRGSATASARCPRPSCGSTTTRRQRVEVRHGWTEMGQGVHTVALQVAAQELGIAPERIDVIVDTTRELGFGQTTGRVAR